jgi:hypothetical protein
MIPANMQGCPDHPGGNFNVMVMNGKTTCSCAGCGRILYQNNTVLVAVGGFDLQLNALALPVHDQLVAEQQKRTAQETELVGKEAGHAEPSLGAIEKRWRNFPDHGGVSGQAGIDVRHLLDTLKFNGDEYEQFIDQVWQIAREGKLGDWDYPAQVLRHLQEMKDEKDAEIARLRAALQEIMGLSFDGTRFNDIARAALRLEN